MTKINFINKIIICQNEDYTDEKGLSYSYLKLKFYEDNKLNIK